MFEAVGESEASAIAALMNRAYRNPDSTSSWTSEAGYISGDRTNELLVREAIRAHAQGRFLKWIDGTTSRPVGCVWLEPVAHGTWYLGSLAIDPERQKSGLGKAMLAAAEEWVRTHGGTRIRMTVINVRQTLIEWYLRRGYRMTGETEPFPYGDNRFGTPMRDDLSFVVLVKDLVS